jgi:hypothetical protein
MMLLRGRELQMLQIRAEQSAIFDQLAERDFESRLMRHCRASWSRETGGFDDAALLDRLRGFIERARGLGIVTETLVVDFVDLCFVWGDAFPDTRRTVWARPVLERKDLDPETRVANLRASTTSMLKD